MVTNILEFMDEAAVRYPGRTAFADDELSLSFDEFKKRADRVGSFLLKKGAVSEPVIIFMRRSPLTLTAFFGTVAAGCFYVPVDTEMPGRRIELILKTTKARWMICDETTYESAVGLDFDGSILKYEDIPDETDEKGLLGVRESSIDTDPVYILFTSGSTGVPKGVVGYHRGVIDYAYALTEALEIDGDCVFGMQSPLYLDACLKEILSTFLYGAATWLIPAEVFLFPKRIVEYLNEHRINTICWVVSVLTMISGFKTFDVVRPKYLKIVAFGSEVFPIKQFNLWRETLPDARFYNLYGPTEATGMSCVYRVDREFSEGDVIPIGRPFRNTRIVLLDKDGNEVAEGAEGEICISGSCLTKGYYNNPEKTKAAFTHDPTRPDYDEMIYHTGDMGYKRDGLLYFASRTDHQIKHMGHRIELGEIEADAACVEGVKGCACVFFRENEKIVLFYSGDITKAELSTRLKERLPGYMVPNAIRQIDRLPLLPNGKLDRMRLMEIYKEERHGKR
ncbi:MAG: amino acid adenylation domain-containing protein [Eubacterium sp.]|nr:amino acid adenylation domain-containing protein [Eubacterium sp.]